MGASPEPICLSAPNLHPFLSIFLLGLGDLFRPSRIAHSGKESDESIIHGLEVVLIVVLNVKVGATTVFIWASTLDFITSYA